MNVNLLFLTTLLVVNDILVESSNQIVNNIGVSIDFLKIKINTYELLYSKFNRRFSLLGY